MFTNTLKFDVATNEIHLTMLTQNFRKTFFNRRKLNSKTQVGHRSIANTTEELYTRL